MSIRNPAVEGRFYPDSSRKILQLISEIEKEERYPIEEINLQSVIGAVLPHAGHVYSGHQTIPFFQLLDKFELYPETFVIIHPNHSGIGDPVSLDESTAWRNTVGEVEIDQEFSSLLNIPKSRLAHANEHSGEVIIPFIQYFSGERTFKIVPVCMYNQSYEKAQMLGNALFRAANLSKRRIMVIASSDFSHFLSAEDGNNADQLVLDEITDGNIEGVIQKVKKHNITVCGYGPIMALMTYAGKINPSYQTKLLARGHSGEVSPSREVVDYISMLFFN